MESQTTMDRTLTQSEIAKYKSIRKDMAKTMKKIDALLTEDMETSSKCGPYKFVWRVGTGDKKYKVDVWTGGAKIKTVQFGHIREKHYQDRTPLKLFTFRDHNDKKLRAAYREKHWKENTTPLTPGWFSYKYLW